MILIFYCLNLSDEIEPHLASHINTTHFFLIIGKLSHMEIVHLLGFCHM